MKRSLKFLLFAGIISIFSLSCRNEAESSSALSALSTSETINQPQQLARIDARLGNTELKIMLARTHAEKAKGLMFYETLAENEGMLFVYSSPRIMSFWMYNTRIPLDLIFFSENLTVMEWIKHMQPGNGKKPEQLPRYLSEMPAQYALELNAGSIEKFGIKYGDKLEIPLTMLYSE